MKPMRQLCAIAVLTFVFASSAAAGNIDCGAVSPPPDPPASITGEMATGATSTMGMSGTEMASIDPLTEFTLSILQSLLSLF